MCVSQTGFNFHLRFKPGEELKLVDHRSAVLKFINNPALPLKSDDHIYYVTLEYDIRIGLILRK